MFYSALFSFHHKQIIHRYTQIYTCMWVAARYVVTLLLDKLQLHGGGLGTRTSGAVDCCHARVGGGIKLIFCLGGLLGVSESWGCVGPAAATVCIECICT